MALASKANVTSYQLPFCEYFPDCICQSYKGSMIVLQQQSYTTEIGYFTVCLAHIAHV